MLQASEALLAVIEAPAAMADPGDIVRINAARDVALAGFTVEGPLPNTLFCSVFPRTGLRVNGGGSAIVRGNRFTEIRSEDPALRGCQNGVAVLVGYAPEGTTGSAVIEQNPIEAYQKAGVVVDNAGSSALIVGNKITGDGPITTIAQNGIQVSNGADALVNGNWVSGQVYSPSPAGAALFFYRPGTSYVVGNVVQRADYGIYTVDAVSPAIQNNTVLACTVNGMDLDEETTGTTGALVRANDSRDNGANGIYVSVSSKQNALGENQMFGDGALDARDDSAGNGTAGTANMWIHNHCKTDNHGGLLCEP